MRVRRRGRWWESVRALRPAVAVLATMRALATRVTVVAHDTVAAMPESEWAVQATTCTGSKRVRIMRQLAELSDCSRGSDSTGTRESKSCMIECKQTGANKRATCARKKRRTHTALLCASLLCGRACGRDPEWRCAFQMLQDGVVGVPGPRLEEHLLDERVSTRIEEQRVEEVLVQLRGGGGRESLGLLGRGVMHQR